MSTISLSFGVPTRIDPELISSLWNSILNFIFGEFGGPRFAEFQKGVKNSRSLYQAQNLFKITKNRSE